jgi:hypothetical protein
MTVLEVLTSMDCRTIFYKNRRPNMPLIEEWLGKLKVSYPRVIKLLRAMLE